ncbi:tobamovirus multiplication protein 1-like isoform x1 [Anaeramoeba ignava]|uniref:Tobamovirus multiplication protein 1-like isoform x1 n=1 Tax=Anaeramoeba ignava TaxID=1746090 RepID=A0A9Q0REX2_ANAIG|nr:tobamovirus multiplication protein 1-like isoform x1 [Anaeramoeba ignava]
MTTDKTKRIISYSILIVLYAFMSVYVLRKVIISYLRNINKKRVDLRVYQVYSWLILFFSFAKIIGSLFIILEIQKNDDYDVFYSIANQFLLAAFFSITISVANIRRSIYPESIQNTKLRRFLIVLVIILNIVLLIVSLVLLLKVIKAYYIFIASLYFLCGFGLFLFTFFLLRTFKKFDLIDYIPGSKKLIFILFLITLLFFLRLIALLVVDFNDKINEKVNHIFDVAYYFIFEQIPVYLGFYFFAILPNKKERILEISLIKKNEKSNEMEMNFD